MGPLFDWYFAGDTEYTVPGGRFTLRVSPQSADLLRESYAKMGALVVSRRQVARGQVEEEASIPKRSEA